MSSDLSMAICIEAAVEGRILTHDESIDIAERIRCKPNLLEEIKREVRRLPLEKELLPFHRAATKL